ncbi:hypothetical protein L541_1328 [Bordetella hinzii CA90 BAL1384]|nr:hypothetical protein L541_1328 [Bordetella hinzii CA90 BAL1384]
MAALSAGRLAAGRLAPGLQPAPGVPRHGRAGDRGVGRLSHLARAPAAEPAHAQSRGLHLWRLAVRRHRRRASHDAHAGPGPGSHRLGQGGQHPVSPPRLRNPVC